LNNLQNMQINTEYVVRTKAVPSGAAMIDVDKNGGDTIVVVPGANEKLSCDDVLSAKKDIISCNAIVAQLEISLQTIEYVAELADTFRIPFILDPAPAQKLSGELPSKVDVLTPNGTEANVLTGMKIVDEMSARKAAESLLKGGVKAVIVTMGAKGSLLATNEMSRFVSARKVDAVDSTAAGDAFTGGLAFELACGKELFDAALFANNVAALCVTRMGAQPAMPTTEVLEKFMQGEANEET